MTMHVVYSTDDNYAPYTAVSMESAVEGSSGKLHFHILIPEALSMMNRFKLKMTVSSEAQVDFIKVDKSVGRGIRLEEYDRLTEHITYPALFRLLLPDLLEDVDTVLYLDGDTLVTGDICEFAKIDISNADFAGVRAYGYYFDKESHSRRLGIPLDCFDYYNSGVLYMNLKNMRKENRVQDFLALLPKKWTALDQDILNAACYGRIVPLPLKYNRMIGYTQLWDERKRDSVIPVAEYEEAVANPLVIHYAMKTKPWNDSALVCADRWLEFKEQSRASKLFQELRRGN